MTHKINLLACPFLTSRDNDASSNFCHKYRNNTVSVLFILQVKIDYDIRCNVMMTSSPEL